jgi:hypothetical protein
MIRAMGIVLAGVAAAAGGAYLGWVLTAAPAKVSTTSAMIQTAGIGESDPGTPAPATRAPAPAPAPAAVAPANEPKGRMEPSSSEANIGSDSGVFKLETPTTNVSLDPKRGQLRFKTPLGSLTFDNEKREARLDAAPLYLGVGW